MSARKARRSPAERFAAKAKRARTVEHDRAARRAGWRQVGGIFTTPEQLLWIGPAGQKAPTLPEVIR
jgi:hypothetical protein